MINWTRRFYPWLFISPVLDPIILLMITWIRVRHRFLIEFIPIILIILRKLSPTVRNILWVRNEMTAYFDWFGRHVGRLMVLMFQWLLLYGKVLRKFLNRRFDLLVLLKESISGPRAWIWLSRCASTSLHNSVLFLILTFLHF